MLYIGLMSGTSADGIDGVLVDFHNDHPEILAACTVDFGAGVKESIESVVAQYPDVDNSRIGALDEALARDFARAVQELASKAPRGNRIVAVGSHGQTIYHGPGDSPPVTVQLGSPSRVAALSGITTVGDFRANDLRAGGQGAPLAPGFHNALFRRPGTTRIIINIGGIANLTHLPADPDAPVLGFDSGPGNTLMDQWCRLHRRGAYDDGGHWAASGRADAEFVEALLTDPYFTLTPPKSTGREYFNLDWMKRRFPAWRDLAPEDIQASLLSVTASSIASAVARLTAGDGGGELYVCGGGAKNVTLMDRIALMSEARVETTAALGVPPGRVEACAFAWLAHRRMQDLPGNIPSVTGARSEVLLGEIHRPPS